jgi:hypothetical protein
LERLYCPLLPPSSFSPLHPVGSSRNT